MARTRGLRVGVVRGVPIYLTPGWALVSAVLVLLLTPSLSTALDLGIAAAAGVALGIPVLLALSVLAHELAHGLTAHRFGVNVREYVLTLWGGHTAFHAEITRPGTSAIVAVAGPVTNAALAGVCWGAAGVMTGDSPRLVLSAVAVTNLVVAVFNLLPALPMDGGRLLEAFVWRLSGDRDLGGLVASRVGQGLAVMLGVAALVWFVTGEGSIYILIWGAMVAAMLWQGATASARVSRARRGVRDVDLGQGALPAATVGDTEPLTALPDVSPRTPVLLLGPDGEPWAFTTTQARDQVPASAWPTTPAHAVATRLEPSALLRSDRGADAVAALAVASRAGARFVVLPGGDSGRHRILDIAAAARSLPR